MPYWINMFLKFSIPYITKRWSFTHTTMAASFDFFRHILRTFLENAWKMHTVLVAYPICRSTKCIWSLSLLCKTAQSEEKIKQTWEFEANCFVYLQNGLWNYHRKLGNEREREGGRWEKVYGFQLKIIRIKRTKILFPRGAQRNFLRIYWAASFRYRFTISSKIHNKTLHTGQFLSSI